MAGMSRSRIALLATVAAVASAAVLHQPTNPEDESLSLELPDVDAVMSDASDSIAALTKQAGLLQSLTKEKNEGAKLMLHKARNSYNSRLAEVEVENANITSSIQALKSKCASLDTGNAAILDHLKEAKVVHTIMRTALGKLNEKFSHAHDFLDIAVRRSHINATKPIEALKPLPLPPTVENFISELEGKESAEDEDLVSLTQMKSSSSLAAQLKARIREEVAPAVHLQAEDEARAIVERLGHGLSDISAAEDDGALQLKAQFLVKFEVLQSKQKALIAERTMVQDSFDTTVERQAQLHKAGQTLRGKTDELVTRLNGIRTFFNTTHSFIHQGLSQAEHEARGGKRTHASSSHA